jgi:hypothetical protein
MKHAGLVPFALAVIACAPLLIAQENTQPSTPTTQPALQDPTKPTPAQADPSPAAQAPNPAANGAATNVELKPVKGELVSKLDSKKAKVGDSVVVKTDEKLTAADGTEIPKGSKLIGHVALVHPHSKDAQNSQLALLFDQAELKNGQSMPIKSTIEAVSPAEGSGGPGSSDMYAAAPAGPAGGGAPGGGGAMNGGGAAGGSRTSGSSAPAPTAPVSSQPTTQGTPATGQGNAPVAGKVVAGSGENAIRTTDIPNIYLASSANGAVSGTLFAAQSDVHLDGGTRMVLDIAPTAAH